jgi:hypothetical protein
LDAVGNVRKGRSKSGDDSRRSAKCARSPVCPDGEEGVCDNGDEEVDEPEIEHDEANDEKEAGNEEL